MRMDIQRIRGLFGQWNAHFLSPLRGSVTVAPHTHGLRRGLHCFAASRLGSVVIVCAFGMLVAQAQSAGGQTQGQSSGAQSQTANQTQSPANSQSSQEI